MSAWGANNRTRTLLKKWIYRKLGEGVINVELTDDQMDDAILEAEEYWQMWVGVVKTSDVITSSSSEIAADDIADDLANVVDVYFDSSSDTSGQYFGWAGVEVNPVEMMGYNFGGGTASLIQYLQYIEGYKRVLSGDTDWDWDKYNRVLTISPSTYGGGRKLRVVYMSTEVEYSYLDPHEWKLFRDYAMCKAMRTLATIRMKFGDKPSATGGFSMDGDAMWANAEALELSIEEKMRMMQYPVGLIQG